MAKAKEIAEKIGYHGFSASNGWLQKWRKRHNIAFKNISGEAADVSYADVTQFRTTLSSILAQYRAEDIYNADESGLFFRALPTKTLAFKSDKCTGGKLSKERLTILFCVNMVGEKERLLLIGKAARPRAFKNMSIAQLPVEWKSNKKAWMTRDIMSEWLHQMDNKMRCCNRKIILFLDNAASHPRDLPLTNINVIFLPANTTSVCQPLDQGIIQNFKVYYRSLVLNYVVSKMSSANSVSELSNNINVLDAICFIKTAWKKVEPTTIANCFRKAGFMHQNQIDNEYDPEDEVPLATLRNFQRISETNETSFEEFLNIDSTVYTENNSFEINIENEETPEILSSDSEEDAVGQEIDKIKSFEEALIQIGRLKTFAFDDFVAYEKLNNLENHFEEMHKKWRQANFKQATIRQFFFPST